MLVKESLRFLVKNGFKQFHSLNLIDGVLKNNTENYIQKHVVKIMKKISLRDGKCFDILFKPVSFVMSLSFKCLIGFQKTFKTSLSSNKLQK